MARLNRRLRALPLLIVSPLLALASFAVLALTDLAWLLLGRRRAPADTLPRRDAASVVIPNWNGRDLLEKYLPSVIEALAGNPANEIIVVDNGSADGSADFVRRAFPRVKLLALERNLGFGGGSNAGFRAAAHDIVVLLNSDMRVDPGFLAPLLEGFDDAKVFAVSCQIFFSDPARVREETGLTQGWWEDGNLRVRHRIDEAITTRFPCFYGGGGSCAFDRRKFLELGGFDELLSPFYLEDTDLGYLAWKRGWKVFYEPRSVVFHEHRGTIGKRFTDEQIQAVLKKNYLLWAWKNIHETPRLIAHFFFSYTAAVVSWIFNDVPLRPNLAGWWRAFRQLRHAAASRWRARSLACIGDTEAFLRPLGGYFRDRFEAISAAHDKLRVLFLSPYPICPPVHGGGVFMYQTLRELARLAEVNLVALLDFPWQLEAHDELKTLCASTHFMVRTPDYSRPSGSIVPHAVREFANADLAWLIHRLVYLQRIDVLQLEYTTMAQYGGPYRRVVTALFEHDIYFQSIARGLEHVSGLAPRAKAWFEYLRALRWELRALARFDQVQVCTRENRDHLAAFLPRLADRIQPGLRAGIDVACYRFRPDGREPCSMLFLGSFRHDPNRVAVEWFVREVLPLVLARRPEARLDVIGSDPPQEPGWAEVSSAIRMLGFVDDVHAALARCAVFVCPIRSGSGVRVKLLEAFACGAPVVSTYIGAEGLAHRDGEVCALADDPAGFAARILDVFDHPDHAAAMAARARAGVERHWDMRAITARLEQSYREALKRKGTGDGGQETRD